MPGKRQQPWRRRSVSGKPRAWTIIGLATVLVAIAVTVAVIASPIGGADGREQMAGATGEEAFRAFANRTSFGDEQVWEAYRFAVANPQDVLNYIPCYCGCVAHGHTNNRDCYVDAVAGNGEVIFDAHGAG